MTQWCATELEVRIMENFYATETIATSMMRKTATEGKNLSVIGSLRNGTTIILRPEIDKILPSRFNETMRPKLNEANDNATKILTIDGATILKIADVSFFLAAGNKQCSCANSVLRQPKIGDNYGAYPMSVAPSGDAIKTMFCWMNHEWLSSRLLQRRIDQWTTLITLHFQSGVFLQTK